ncbi:MAG: hypothetical protein IT368_05355 [Candidatus Hydrogenedentes bacterium]|nr:hypothetical protein [Candidatus Hydrogenedentota bacterium]
MSTLDLLVRQFPGAAAIPLRQAGPCIGLDWRTLANREAQGRPILPSIKVGGRRMVKLLDLAAYIDSLGQPATTPPVQAPQAKRSPGRPRKMPVRATDDEQVWP